MRAIEVEEDRQDACEFPELAKPIDSSVNGASTKESYRQTLTTNKNTNMVRMRFGNLPTEQSQQEKKIKIGEVEHKSVEGFLKARQHIKAQ